MTPLRLRMIEDMRVRNLAANTQRIYVDRVANVRRARASTGVSDPAAVPPPAGNEDGACADQFGRIFPRRGGGRSVRTYSWDGACGARRHECCLPTFPAGSLRER